MKIPREEFIDVLEDRVPYQWKPEFKKEGFDLSLSTLKEFLDKEIQVTSRDTSQPEQALGEASAKQTSWRKAQEDFFDYHDLSYHDTDKCDVVQARRKHVQPTHHITKQQRLWQVQFVKDVKRCTKRRGLTGKEVKDLNAFVKDKIDKTIKEHDCDMHAMSDFKDLSISSSNDSIKSIISGTSDEESDSDSCKPAHKK
eukprot:4811219-Ditylum_brightwellii.AAC.1